MLSFLHRCFFPFLPLLFTFKDDFLGINFKLKQLFQYIVRKRKKRYDDKHKKWYEIYSILYCSRESLLRFIVAVAADDDYEKYPVRIEPLNYRSAET